MEAATRRFGSLDLRVGDVFVADGGIHGVQGHRLHVRADGTASWARQVDSVYPVGAEGAGEMSLTPDECDRLHAWADAAWRLAPVEHATDQAPPAEPEIPRWVWVVAVCRGSGVRVLEGGGMAFDDAPVELAAVLGWLRDRVDAVAGTRGRGFRDWVRRHFGR